jgi:hypothetical protein
MPIYFLLQGLQVKLAPFVSEYCINIVCILHKIGTTIFCFCNTKKRHPKGVAGLLITVTADDTCTPQLLYILTYYILYVVAFLLPDRKFVIHPV